METELRTLKLFSRIIFDKPYNIQSFPYKNHRKHYKKVASIFRPTLFTLKKFFLKHKLSSSKLLKENKNLPDKKFHNQKWYVLFFTRIKVVAHVLVSTCAIACIKWRRLNNISYLTYLQFTDLAKADSQ